MHLGKNISRIRELLGIKQKSLAATLKISKKTLSRIEQAANLRECTVERIAIALGASPNMILNYNDQLLIDFLKEDLTLTNKFQEATLVPLAVLEKTIELYERLLQMDRDSYK